MEVQIPFDTDFNKAQSINLKPKKVKKHSELLLKLTEEIKEIDFWEKTDTKKGTKLKQNHYYITVVEELLELGKEMKWNICKYNEMFYLYNEAYWGALSRNKVEKFLTQAAQKFGMDKFYAKDHKFIEKLYKQFMFDADFPERSPNIYKILINLRNGTFEIDRNGGQLKEFSASDFLTYQLSFDYNPDAKCELFMSYLNEVLPDKDSQKILAEYIGYVFTRHLKLEKVLFLYGGGGNGKSVIFDIINALIGSENISNMGFASLEKEVFRAELSETLLNYCSEMSNGISINTFKQLASNEPIMAKRLYEKPFKMENYAKLMINGNELLKNVEHNEAFFRRLIIIHFDKTIPKEKRKVNLAANIIKNELSGVFNWVLEGLNRLLIQEKFTHSNKVEEFIEAYKKESDNVQLFLEEEGYIKADRPGDLLTKFHANFQHYCHCGGYSGMGRKNFKKRLERLGYRIERVSKGVSVFAEKS